MDLFDLVAKITLDSSEYEKGIGNASSKASDFGQGLKNGLKTATKVGAVAIGAVSTATAALATSLVKGTSEIAAYGDNIDKMSQKMGLTAEAYQEWDAIMQHSGTSIESMQRGMTTLSAAAENGSAAFEAVGLSLEDVANMNQEELFSATITALQNMESGTERTVLAQQLLGGSAKELGALLNTSAEDTEAMRQRVHELGGVMSNEAVKSAAAYQDSLQDMQTAFSGLKRGFVAEFMPAITTVMDGLTEIFSGNSGSGIQLISEGINSLISTISQNLPQFISLGSQILRAILEAIISNLPALLKSGGEIIGQLIAGLLSAIPQLIAMAPELVMAIVNGLASAWPSIKEAGMELVNNVGEGFVGAVASAWTWGRDLVQNFLNGIAANVGALWESVKNMAGGIRRYIGFSEPEEGPLSNFHTYAPDMMKLFAKGIKDNEDIVTDQLEKSFNFESEITPNIKSNGTGIRGGNSDGGVINLVAQVVLDGKVIGETAYRYSRQMARANG